MVAVFDLLAKHNILKVVRDTVEMGGASRDSTGFVLMEEGLISG